MSFYSFANKPNNKVVVEIEKEGAVVQINNLKALFKECNNNYYLEKIYTDNSVLFDGNVEIDSFFNTLEDRKSFYYHLEAIYSKDLFIKERLAKIVYESISVSYAKNKVKGF